MKLDHSPKHDPQARLAYSECRTYLRGRDPAECEDAIIIHIAEVMSDARTRDAEARSEDIAEGYRLAVEADLE